VTAQERGRYHHGRLRQAAIEAAVHEVEAVGSAAVSMREIARRAGVSHAALAYQFGDKAGIFTAIATEGFRLATEMIGPVAIGPEGFLRGGEAYIRCALTHPGHFEVMFQPELHRTDDPDLAAARDAAFDVLYRSARTSAGVDPDQDITGLVVAGWSMAHGFATLWRTANLQDRLGANPETFARQLTLGLVTLGELAQRQLGNTSGPDGDPTSGAQP
jgi:AcrR family transcriptional regulator